MSLLDLTPEVLHEVLIHLDPSDISRISMTCHEFHTFTDPSNNGLLWKALFLHLFDPLEAPGGGPVKRAGIRPAKVQGKDKLKRDGEEKVDYGKLVKARCRARGVIRNPHNDTKVANREAVLRTLLDVFHTASDTIYGLSKNATFLSTLLGSKSNVEDWLFVPSTPTSGTTPLRGAALPPHGTGALLPPPAVSVLGPSMSALTPAQLELHSISCQLHVSGLSMNEIAWSSYKQGQGYREMIYRGSHFEERNRFGPFQKREDGRVVVDWILLDAVARVMALNVRSAWHQWAEPEEMSILPYGFDKAVFWKQPGPGRDWAGVEANFSYIYAFIDYNDFFAFNFAGPMLANGAPNNLDGISEAVGGVNTLSLQLLSLEDSPPLCPEDEDNPYPPLYFVGTSSNPNGSTFRGTVRLLEDGNRYWTFVIRYSGADRWQTECVEVGGRGMYGIWSDVLHEELSPCGPVWYFRE